jgi:glycosyltransferase involved in cell wall biosynthesis
LIQFGTTALSIKDALDPDKQRIFVHVHGHDTQEELCPSGYRDEITRLLSSRITTICNSYETFSRLTKWGVPTDNLVVKYMGVPLPDIETREHDNFVILFLGRLVDCKSPDRTIQAFELACEKGLKAQLIIAGDGPLRITCELLKARSKWKDAITMLGEVSWEQGKPLYEQADMFTQHAMVGELTGQVEAFGVSIVEAMATALPVSTCLIGGISETVIEGETGLIFEPQNIEQQAETFLKLAHDKELRKRLGANARQRVKEHFSIDIEARNLLRILTQKD